tara:strand:- start:989 stop:2548 length:1560 start_codon:yes stop_codon:yes gene_type:complete
VAEFDEDINLEESDNLLSGVVKATAVGVGGSALIKGSPTHKALSRTIIPTARRINNVVNPFYKSGANQALAFVQHGLTSEYKDVQRLIKGAQKSPMREYLGSDSNAYKEMLDSINDTRKKLKLKPIGILNPDGTRDYSKLNPKSFKLYGQISNPNVLKAMREKGLSSVGSIIAKADEFTEIDRIRTPGEAFKQTGRMSRIYRHEELKNALVKHVAGVPLDDLDKRAFKLRGLTLPEQSTVGKMFPQKLYGNNKVINPHFEVFQKWKLLPTQKVTFSQITNAGDKGILTSSIKNSNVHHFHEYVAERLHQDGLKPNKKSIRGYGKEYLNERIAEQKRNPIAYKEKYRKIHSADKLDNAIKYFTKNAKVKNGMYYINFSPQNKPNFLLGGVNVNSGLGYIKGKLRHDRLVTDMYDILKADTLLATDHMTFMHDTDLDVKNRLGKGSKMKVKPVADNVHRKAVKKLMKSGDYKKAWGVFQKGSKILKANQLHHLKKFGKVGKAAAAIGTAAILGKKAWDKWG